MASRKTKKSVPATPWSTYQLMMNRLCEELGVPGCPTFDEALDYLKKRLRPINPGSTRRGP